MRASACGCVYSVRPSLKICVAQGKNTYNNNIIITVIILWFINARNVDGPVTPTRRPDLTRLKLARYSTLITTRQCTSVKYGTKNKNYHRAWKNRPSALGVSQ